jgi:hypothetical protein
MMGLNNWFVLEHETVLLWEKLYVYEIIVIHHLREIIWSDVKNAVLLNIKDNNDALSVTMVCPVL